MGKRWETVNVDICKAITTAKVTKVYSCLTETPFSLRLPSPSFSILMQSWFALFTDLHFLNMHRNKFIKCALYHFIWFLSLNMIFNFIHISACSSFFMAEFYYFQRNTKTCFFVHLIIDIGILPVLLITNKTDVNIHVYEWINAHFSWVITSQQSDLIPWYVFI